jgi:hypothetical protein
MVNISKISTENVSKLKNDMFFAILDGNYKAFKNARKSYATIAVKDFDAVKNIQAPTIQNVPLFSKLGLKMLKVVLLNKFRIKSADEKNLIKMEKQLKKTLKNPQKMEKEFKIIENYNSLPANISYFSKLKSNKTKAVLNGTYKEYVEASKKFAKSAKIDMKYAVKAPNVKVENIPIKKQAKMLWFLIRDTFRTKTPEEKALNQYVKSLKR